MTGKELKKYNILEYIFSLNIFSDEDNFLTGLKKALDFDYSFAVDIWDYYLTINEKALADNKELLVGKVAEVFKKDTIKFYKATFDRDSIKNAYYKYSENIFNDELVKMLASLLVSGKVELADDIFKILMKNEKCNFSEFLYLVVDCNLAELSKKSKDGKIAMQKKVKTLYLDYVKKIKAAQGILIAQRLREIK